MAVTSARRMTEIESELMRLAQKIPIPTAVMGKPNAVVGSMFGHRARSLYEGLLHSLDGPSKITPIIDARSLIELAIRIKWVSVDPDRNGDLWMADSEDTELRHIVILERTPGIQAPTATKDMQEALEEKKRIADEGRALLSAEGVNYGHGLIPSLERMVQEIETKDPNHRAPARQLYDAGYRSLSGWAHTDASSFKATLVLGPEGARYAGQIAPYRAIGFRSLGASAFAYILETIDPMVGRGMAVAARLIRDEITLPSPADH